MKPKKIKASQLSIIKMTCGNEKKKNMNTVIAHGDLMDWVGFGWITLRKATPADYRKYSEVDYD